MLLSIVPLASKGYWLPGLSDACLPDDWVGGAVITSDKNIIANGRPHINGEVMTYDSFSAAFTIKYYKTDGTLSCTDTDTVLPLASKGYWLPTLLSTECLPSGLADGWIGGVVVTSDVDIVAIGRPHVGAQVTTYDGFISGSMSSYLPMLFKDAYSGSYDSTFYIQNTEGSAATVITKFYDSTGALTCSRNDTLTAFSTLSLWLPSLTCTP
jgi:hypothetical protein